MSTTDLEALIAQAVNNIALPAVANGDGTGDNGADGAGTGSNDPCPSEPMTELGYARRFIHVYGNDLRYVTTWKKWLVWDGARWAHDTTGQAQRWMKVIARRLTLDAESIRDSDRRREALKLAKRGEASAGVSGALTLASTESEVAVSHDQLDADPYLLNCRNGTVDLRTGHLRPHDQADLLTQLTGAQYVPVADGPAWEAFLADIQPDPSMRSYLARLLGHAIEGRQATHILPIFCGDGANGKSTLIDAVMHALGDYAASAAAGLLTARKNDSHPTDVADLFGRRLAVLHETDAGRNLAEGTVKRLTGGDRIKARRMREDFWEFLPSHTFVMLTNHKPQVKGNDEGIWRRLRLVPFDVVIPAERRDDQLGERLASEADAILTWLIRGYTSWREHGLDDPDQVTTATQAYRAEADALGRFLEESCRLASGWHTRSSELYAAWRQWCTSEGEEPGSNKKFSEALKERGFETRRTNVGMVVDGIGLMANSSTDGWATTGGSQ